MSNSREWYQSVNQKLTYDHQVAAADTATLENVLAARNSSHTVYVQAIMFTPSTGAAKTLTFQDDAGSPVVIAKTPDPGVQGEVYIYDFGPKGTPLTAGKNLDVVISGAGLAGSIHIEGYQRLTAVVAATSA